MRSVRKRLLIWVLGLLLNVFPLLFCGYAAGQTLPGLPSKPETPATQPEAATPADPFGRETPSGCFYGFLNAVNQEKYQIAAQYLELSPSRRKSQGEQLSKQLLAVLDQGLVGVSKVTTNPEGTVQEGVPLDRERVGRISGANGAEINVDLVRVSDPEGGTIWLFSADTLAKVPALYEDLQAHRVETKIPAILVKNEFVGVPLWQWMALLVAFPAAAAVAWLLILLVVVPRRIWRHFRTDAVVESWIRVSGPVWFMIGVFVNAIIVELIRLPLLARHYYFILLKVAFLTGLAWLVLRVVTQVSELLHNRAVALGKSETGSLVLLGQRLLKVLVIVAAGLLLLRALGFDMTTALAGVGIGGLALSFGAQKTIENLFGGVSVLGDAVIRVGDFCRIADRLGTVEDISLRSTLIRTLERTELSVPNGTLAAINVENFSRRDKILFKPTLGVRYETSPDQLRCLLAEIRRFLYQHPKVETSSARARFAGFGDSALLIEIFSFVCTRDYAEFTAIREDLLLQIMDIVTQAGTGFAFPSRTLYLGRDSGLDREKTEAAVQKSQQWRDEKQMPFPDFPPLEIAEIRDSLPYPSPDSALSDRSR